MHEGTRAEVLAELRRIGVDATTLTAPLVGTGLRASDVVAWLRALPDDAGLDALLLRLDEHARQALGGRPLVRWTRNPPVASRERRHERHWPTQELADAGTEMLLEQWDPFMLRHVAVDREEVAMCAFHFFGCFLAPNGLIDPMTHATEMIASAERTRLGLTPSPERHRRYLASQLSDLVQRYPIPPAKYRAPSALVVIMGDRGPPPLDPEGVCARCHSFGTVARLTELFSPPVTRRYCEQCWAVVRREWLSPPTQPRTAAEHIASWDRSEQPPMESESRAWIDTIENIKSMYEAVASKRVPEAEVAPHCARFAVAILEMENRMAGPMPPEVENFVRRYAPPPPTPP